MANKTTKPNFLVCLAIFSSFMGGGFQLTARFDITDVCRRAQGNKGLNSENFPYIKEHLRLLF